MLLLDEPTEGIQPSIISEMARTLKKIRDERGLSIVVSEQVLSFALDIADRVLVMENGDDRARSAARRHRRGPGRPIPRGLRTYATFMADYEIFELGDHVLQCGKTLRNAKLAFKTFGTLNAARDNAIVYPTWYSGQHTENECLIGRARGSTPSKYFIIIPNMFGNGLSSSPSNTPAPWNGPRFPNVTAYDNVRRQHRLVTEHFGIDIAGAGDGVVDGGAPDLPLGRALSGHGPAHPAV